MQYDEEMDKTAEKKINGNRKTQDAQEAKKKEKEEKEAENQTAEEKRDLKVYRARKWGGKTDTGDPSGSWTSMCVFERLNHIWMPENKRSTKRQNRIKSGTHILDKSTFAVTYNLPVYFYTHKRLHKCNKRCFYTHVDSGKKRKAYLSAVSLYE